MLEVGQNAYKFSFSLLNIDNEALSLNFNFCGFFYKSELSKFSKNLNCFEFFVTHYNAMSTTLPKKIFNYSLF